MKLYNKGKIVSNHFKRKRRQRYTKADLLSKLIIVVMVLILVYFVSDIIKDNKKEYDLTEIQKQTEAKVVEDQRLRAEADLTKAILDVRTSKSERFVNEVTNEIEYITLKQDGTNSVEHSRLNEDAGWWKKTFTESSITVNFDYAAIFSIATSDINIYVSDGVVHIDYDPNIIDVKSIEVSNITTTSKKDWFGKKYSNQELVSIVDLAKENIYKELNADANLKKESSDNLNTYFTELAKKMELDGFIINNEEIIEQPYTFIDKGNVKYNHPFEHLQSVDYIVIHSTDCIDLDAMDFYNRLNTSKTERGTSANYYVDDKNVVEAIDNNLKSYHCGINNKINCTNNNSLGLEITEFGDPVRQQKAIENAVSFVNEVLLKEFPNAKVLMHRQVKPTQCPHILTDEQFAQYFNNN